MAESSPPEPAGLRDGRYSIRSVLGSGSQGDTLDAFDTVRQRPVAIKRFRIRGATSWKNVELAEREARVLARLSHPALPSYVEHFEEEGALYLVMERMEGTSLATIRQTDVGFDQRDVERFLRDAAVALDYLHRQAPPVIHRDIKPGNVLLRRDGSFAFVDFGCVRDSLRPEGGSTVVGTFGYMAPEQFQGRALPQSDVYAVGATALTMLTGTEPERLPHRGLAIDVRAALRGIAGRELVASLERMLDPDPDRRASSITPLLASWPDRTVPPPQSRRHAERERGEPKPQEQGSARHRVHRRTRSQRRQSETAPSNAPRARKRGWVNGGLDELGREIEDAMGDAWQQLEQEFGHPRRRRASRRSRMRGWDAQRVRNALVFGRLGLMIARGVIWLLFCAMAPTILTLLSLLIGPKLQRAASAAEQLGRRVDGKLRQAAVQMEEYLLSRNGRPRVRVDQPGARVDSPGPRQRVPSDASWSESEPTPTESGTSTRSQP